MNRFEEKARKIIRNCWAYDDMKKMEIIAKELETEYKNGEHIKRRKQARSK